MHSAGARAAELMAFTARASPKSGRLVEHWVDNRLESATTCSNLEPTSVLKIYARRPIWMWLSQRALPNPGELSELAQIFNFYKFGRTTFKMWLKQYNVSQKELTPDFERMPFLKYLIFLPNSTRILICKVLLTHVGKSNDSVHWFWRNTQLHNKWFVAPHSRFSKIDTQIIAFKKHTQISTKLF